MFTNRLPPELIDRIIDFLHHDKRSLSQFSLISKSWNPRARFHLFSSPRIFCGPDIDTEYRKHFYSAPKVAIKYVTDLSLFGSPRQTHRYSKETTIFCDTVVALIQGFPNARSITLTNLYIQSTPAGRQRQLPDPLPPRQIRSLVLDRITFRPRPSTLSKEKDLLDNLFRHFHTAELHVIDNTFGPFTEFYTTPVSVSMVSWRLRGLSALVRFRSLEPLRAFSFDPVTIEELAALRKPDVAKVFDDLRVLELCIDKCIGSYLRTNIAMSNVPASEWMIPFDVFPKVEHLVLNAFPKFGSYGEAFLVAIIDILKSIVGHSDRRVLSTLRTLTLKLPIFRPAVASERWADLCSVLTQLNLDDIRIQLKFDISKGSLEGAQRHLMGERLQPLWTRGTLKYEPHQPAF